MTLPSLPLGTRGKAAELSNMQMSTTHNSVRPPTLWRLFVLLTAFYLQRRAISYDAGVILQPVARQTLTDRPAGNRGYASVPGLDIA